MYIMHIILRNNLVPTGNVINSINRISSCHEKKNQHSYNLLSIPSLQWYTNLINKSIRTLKVYNDH